MLHPQRCRSFGRRFGTSQCFSRQGSAPLPSRPGGDAPCPRCAMKLNRRAVRGSCNIPPRVAGCTGPLEGCCMAQHGVRLSLDGACDARHLWHLSPFSGALKNAPFQHGYRNPQHHILKGIQTTPCKHAGARLCWGYPAPLLGGGRGGTTDVPGAKQG